ncbi:MAG: hypothetical protein ACXIVF_06855 [Rhizobiaceae bacterium]
MTGTLALLLGALPALAQERWQAEEERAEARLPAPQGETSIVSARLVCAEQSWSFFLTTDTSEVGSRQGTVELRVDGNETPTQATFSEEGLEISVPFETLDPLKRGIGLTFRFEREDWAEAFGQPRFSLIGSRVAITAMEDTCTPPDMSAYRALTFSPFSSYMAVARELREDDIAQFRLATTAEPELAVAMAEFGNGRRVLFTRLCGSSWYFGRTGCNVTGFAPGTDEEEWRIVYDSEGVSLHIDHASDEYGWSDLVTLPLRGQGEASTWRWRGSQYRLLAN